MIKIIPFKVEHLECMEMREHEKGLIGNENMKAFEGVAFTGLIDGRIISCGGVVIEKWGNAYVWQVPSVYVNDVKMSYCKYIRKWLDDVASEYALNRFETTCVNDDLHNRWMKFLGFEVEGIKKKYINGQDYVMFGKVME
ncbi:putative acetyltransferase [Caudoviricetes sp.]|nr:putative acetyltransferase [Caudoviricetes sp.]